MDKEIVDQSVVVEPSPHAETPDAPSETLPPTGGAPMNEMIQLLRLTSMQGPLAQIKKEKKPMAKVSIPGMSTVFGDASPCRRVVWTLVLLVCFSIATIQVRVFQLVYHEFTSNDNEEGVRTIIPKNDIGEIERT